MVITNRVIQRAFPIGDKRRIQLPKFRGPEGVGSWRMICPRETVRSYDPLNPTTGGFATDEDGFYPIQAVFVGCVALQGPGYGPWPVYENDGLSRCAIYLDSVVTPFDLNLGPLTMEWRVKCSAASVSNLLKSGSISFASQDLAGTTITKTGLIVDVSGPLGNQFELWARILPTNGQMFPMEVSLQFIVDRLGDRGGAILGAISGGGELPTLNMSDT